MGSLVREYRQFPSGNTFKPTETFNNISDGTTVTVYDTGPYYEPPPANTDFDYCVHSHIFWNAAGSVSTGSSATATIKGTTKITGWYQYGCSPGGGGAAITCYAFDVDADATMAGTTPIAGVSPSGLWTAPSQSVTVPTSGSVTIDAKNSIGTKDFGSWLVFGAGTTSADDVIIPANSGGFYVATYKQPKGGGVFLPGFLDDLVFEKWPDLDIDWVVDPSPIDRVRLALIMAQMAQRGGGGGGQAGTRAELARVKAEIKRLEGLKESLQDQVKKSK